MSTPGLFVLQMSVVTVQTCPARVAAAVAAHRVTTVSVTTVTALTTLQPIGAILTKTNVTIKSLNGHKETLLLC